MPRIDGIDIPGDVNSLRNMILKEDYSEEFDNIRKAMVITSHYKYGAVKNNFGDLGGVDAIETLKMCLEKLCSYPMIKIMKKFSKFLKKKMKEMKV